MAELPIFANLSGAALDAIARITKEYAFDDNAVIAYQRDVAGRFYIIKEGRLFARAIDENGITRESYAYNAGQYFNDVWLLVPGVHAATIKGAAPNGGSLYVIESADFAQLLKSFPTIIDELAPEEMNDIHYGLSDEAWIEAQKLKIRPRRTSTSAGGAMLPDEYLELFTRRSWWFLAGRLVVPGIIFTIALILLAVMPSDTRLELTARLLLPGILTLIGGIMLGLRLIDFRADYFLITNKHLTHHEFELRQFRIHLVKVPISEVQTVEVLKPNFWSTLFNIGTARVTTAAIAGVVLFDNIDNPIAVKRTLERLITQYRSVESAQTQAVMRRSIEQHFGLEPQLTPAGGEERPLAPTRPQRESALETFRRRFGWRVVEGNTITYRKSLFILIREVGLPLLVYVLLTLGTIAAVYMDAPMDVLVLIVGIIALVNTFWFIWQLENWRNDVFILTDRFVLDVDRKPFGFGESRKQAAIGNIQNVDATRPGFLPTLFNYGFVSVDTAGSKSDIVFDYVPNPELIQGDIFQRIDEARRQQRIQEGSSRREEYALLLDVYRQAMEQQRIPQRTPTEIPDEFEEET